MKTFQTWLLTDGNWVEQDLVEAKNRKQVCSTLKEKYTLGTWKVRLV